MKQKLTSKIPYDEVPIGETALFPENGGWVAIDNRDGESFTEWFPANGQAMSYLDADYGTGDEFRHEAKIDGFESKRGIGANALEALITLKSARRQEHGKAQKNKRKGRLRSQ